MSPCHGSTHICMHAHRGGHTTLSYTQVCICHQHAVHNYLIGYYNCPNTFLTPRRRAAREQADQQSVCVCLSLYSPYIKMPDRPPSISVLSVCNEMNMKPRRLRSEPETSGPQNYKWVERKMSWVCLIRARGGLTVLSTNEAPLQPLTTFRFRAADYDDSSVVNACVLPSSLFYLYYFSFLWYFTGNMPETFENKAPVVAVYGL